MSVQCSTVSVQCIIDFVHYYPQKVKLFEFYHYSCCFASIGIYAILGKIWFYKSSHRKRFDKSHVCPNCRLHITVTLDIIHGREFLFNSDANILWKVGGGRGFRKMLMMIIPTRRRGGGGGLK